MTKQNSTQLHLGVESALFCLEDVNSNSRICGNAIALLGYVGKAEDIKFVDDYFHELLTHSTEETFFSRCSSIAYGSGRFSGMMIRRKIKGAEPFFNKYAQFSAWTTPGNESKLFWPYTLFLVEACRYSFEDYAIKAVRAVAPDGGGPGKFSFESVAETESDVYTLTMRPCEISAASLERKLDTDYKKHKIEIDSLVKKAMPLYDSISQ